MVAIFFIHLGVLPNPLILKIRIFGFLTAMQEVAGSLKLWWSATCWAKYCFL